MEGTLIMTDQDRKRYGRAVEVIEGRMDMETASRLVGLRRRQMARIVARVREEGASGVQHRLRNRPSNHRFGEEKGRAIEQIVREQYGDFGPTLAAEKLAERHGLAVSVGTVRKIMVAAGIWQAGKQGKRHRARRERRARCGEMVQVDGSYHDWFEGRRAKAVLLAFIDDATSRLAYALFVEGETTEAVMTAMWEYIERNGLPLSIYVDRDSIYVVNRQATVEEQLRDKQPQTHFDRAMEELSVQVILARSPQAKGRVERLFKTLQDRLVKELRLRGISTLAEANRYLWEEYLPAHNKRFAVEPRETQDAHRAAPSAARLAAVFTVREERTVQNDYTVRYRNQVYQIGRQQAVRVSPRQRVIVEQRLDGTRHFLYKGVALHVTDVSGMARPRMNGGRRMKTMPTPSRVERWKPAPDHPWRNRPVAEKEAPREGASLAPLSQRPRAKSGKPCQFY